MLMLVIADRRFAVVVPFIGAGHHALREDPLRIVFARLEFVADDGHFREKVLALDVAVEQPIGLELDAELEVVVGCGHGFEVIGAVDPGGAVEAGAMIAEGLRHVGMGRSALEDHVLQQVGHAGFAVAFVAGADKDGHIDGDGGLESSGKEEKSEAVVEPILGNALQRLHFGGSGAYRMG